MIIYGYRAKTLGSETITSPCPQCQHGSATLWGFSRYFHIWYIPFFPFQKMFVLECQNCQKSTEKKEWQETVRNIVQSKASNFKTPIHLFAGVFIAVGVFGYLSFASMNKTKQTTARLSAPKVGDVIVVYQKSETKGIGYWPALVEKVTDDAIIVRPANYAYPSENGVDSHLLEDMKSREDFFSESVLAYPRREMTPEIVKRVVRKGE